MSLRTYFRIFWAAGGCAFLLASVRPRWMRPQPLDPTVSVRSAAWYDGDFQPGATYPSTQTAGLPRGAATLGSWQGGDEWQGSVQTRWERLGGGQLIVFVAGYPRDRGCSLRGEFMDGQGGTTREACGLGNPGETWAEWDVSVPPGAVQFRLVAEDRSARSQGWIAFSQPFVLPPRGRVTVFQCLQVMTTFALGLTLFWLPGLYGAAWLARKEAAAAVIIGTGPLVMAGIGLASWLLGGWIPPVATGACGAFLLWACWGFSSGGNRPRVGRARWATFLMQRPSLRIFR